MNFACPFFLSRLTCKTVLKFEICNLKANTHANFLRFSEDTVALRLAPSPCIGIEKVDTSFKVLHKAIHLNRRLTARFCPNCSKREERMKFGTKMHLGVKDSNWLGAMRKLMSELFGGGGGSFSVHMFACKNKNVKCFSLQVTFQVHNLSQTTR